MVDFSKQFFGKSLNKITYEDIEIFFEEEREESNILEFKSGQDDDALFDDALNKKIIRAISSFLNSEGGLLIWGAPREVTKDKGSRKVKVAQGALYPNKVYNEKDHLLNKIIRSISYMPTGVKLVILEKGPAFLYVFEVQESDSKPHQYDSQYLVRIDGQTLPAPHYLVDSMFKAIKLPELDGRIIFSEWLRKGKNLIINFAVVIENRSILVNETNLSYQLVAHPGHFYSNSKGLHFSAKHDVLHYGRPWLNNHALVVPLPSIGKLDTISLTLAFGGEKGVSLTSNYTIDPSKFKQNVTFDFSNCVPEYSENKSFKERQEELGVTHDDSIKRFIKTVRVVKP